MLDRIILDESQPIRNLSTNRLSAQQAASAKHRHCFTATICYNTMLDIRGHLAFLERPHFSYSDLDRKIHTRNQGRWGVNDAYTRAVDDCDPQRFHDRRQEFVRDVRARRMQENFTANPLRR